jgi:hypothetical protein
MRREKQISIEGPSENTCWTYRRHITACSFSNSKDARTKKKKKIGTLKVAENCLHVCM